MALYSDLNTYDPTNKPLLYDIESIYQSIDNIINSQPYEVLFDPEFPIESLEDSLFEIIDDVTAVEIYRVVTSMIERHEPRVTIVYSETSVTADPNNNRFILKLVVQVKGYGAQKFEINGNITKPE